MMSSRSLIYSFIESLYSMISTEDSPYFFFGNSSPSYLLRFGGFIGVLEDYFCHERDLFIRGTPCVAKRVQQKHNNQS